MLTEERFASVNRKTLSSRSNQIVKVGKERKKENNFNF